MSTSMRRTSLSLALAIVASVALATSSASAATNTLPGDPIPASPVSGSLSLSDSEDVYRIHLNVGDTIELDLMPPQGQLWLYLHGPAAVDIGGGVLVAQEYDNATTHRIRYVATQAGDYNVRIHYNECPTIPNASYKLVWSLRPAGTPPRVKAYLTPPSRPSVVRRYRTFTSSGYLKPRHTAGACSVVIRCYHKEGSIWRLRKTVRAKNYNYSTYTKYQASVMLPTTGYWKLAAYAPEDYRHLLTTAFSPIFRVY